MYLFFPSGWFRISGATGLFTCIRFRMHQFEGNLQTDLTAKQKQLTACASNSGSVECDTITCYMLNNTTGLNKL